MELVEGVVSIKMEFKFNYQGKKFKIDVKECKNVLSKVSGLMFRNNSKPLLFYFGKPRRYRIHSFFCKPFVGIWFDGENIIDVKKIRPWIFWIQPRKKFDKLLEIPVNSEYFSVFSDEGRNI